MLKRIFSSLVVMVGLAALVWTPSVSGVTLERVFSYQDCPVLTNDTTRVVLCPHAGGRVLEYSWKGTNALYLDPKEADWGTPGGRPPMSAGRFDIGPEKRIPRRDVLWSGQWTSTVMGERHVRLTSQPDEATGVRLHRDLVLAAEGSHLACTQTIENVSGRTVAWCHWSRTFAAGYGTVIIPLTEPSKFPNGYVMYEGKSLIDYAPEDPSIIRRQGYLEITAAPREPKLGMDSTAGWFAYAEPSGLLFVKRFRVDSERVYNEVAGLTISIWYPAERPMVELEPIGPREVLQTGERASFTEHWWLLEQAPATAGHPLDLDALAGRVRRETLVP